MARPDFFCGADALEQLLKLELPGGGEEIDLTIDLIDAPYLLLYTVDENSWRMRAFARGERYSHDESGIERGTITVDRASGQGSGRTTDKRLAKDLGSYFNACRQLVRFIHARDIEPLYQDLDPERAGILLRIEDGDLTYRVVAGDERPELMCNMLQGGTAMCRPYQEDFNAGSAEEESQDDELVRAARAGDVYAMRRLARAYQDGTEERERDPERAFYWMRELAEAGDLEGKFNLGLYCAKGFGCRRDFSEAARRMEEALAGGDEDARPLAALYRRMEEDLPKAEAGDPAAQASLAAGYMALSGSLDQAGPDKDYEESAAWAEKAAAQGEPEGIWELAAACENGLGVEKDPDRALSLYRQGAALGHAKSQYALGCCYLRGDYLDKDEEQGFRLCMDAAENGFPLAMSAVGSCYQSGTGVTRDMGKAIEWYDKYLMHEDDPELRQKVAMFRMLHDQEDEDRASGAAAPENALSEDGAETQDPAAEETAGEEERPEGSPMKEERPEEPAETEEPLETTPAREDLTRREGPAEKDAAAPTDPSAEQAWSAKRATFERPSPDKERFLGEAPARDETEIASEAQPVLPVEGPVLPVEEPVLPEAAELPEKDEPGKAELPGEGQPDENEHLDSEEGRFPASVPLRYTRGETLHLPGYRFVLPNGARYRKGAEGRDLIAWLPGEDPDNQVNAPLIILAGQESGGEMVAQMITAEEYEALSRAVALEGEAAGMNDDYRWVEVIALEDAGLPGGAVCGFAQGCAHVNAMVALHDRVKRMRLQFNDVRPGEEEAVLRAAREIFSHMIAVPPVILLDDLDAERFVAPALDEQLATAWERNIEQRVLHLRNARMQVQTALVGAIKARRQKGDTDMDAVREQVLDMLRRFSQLTDRHLEKGAAAFRKIMEKSPDDPLLLRLRDALLDMAVFADQTVEVNGERLLVRSQIAARLRRELDLPELQALSASHAEARAAQLHQLRDLLVYYTGKRREEEEQAEQLRAKAAQAARERERLELEGSVRVERERFEKAVKDWERQCDYVTSRRKSVADERVSAQMREKRKALLDDRDRELARLDEEEKRQRQIKADAEALLPRLGMFRGRERREKQAEIANADSILGQIGKDRLAAKKRFEQSLRQLSENESSDRSAMLQTVSQELPMPEKPREPEELLRAEQALREHRSEAVAQFQDLGDGAVENALKAKVLSRMVPERAYDLDQMLVLMRDQPELTPMRLTALLAKMIRDGVLVRTVYKDKSFYSLA